MVISLEKSNNKVLTMLVTLKQSTVFSYSTLNSDFIILLLKHYFPIFYLEMLISKVAQRCHLAPGRFEIRRFYRQRIMKKNIGPCTPLRGSSMIVPQET